MAKKELKPSQIQAQIEAENAAALEALRKRREKEHKKRTKKTIEEKRIITKTPDWFDKNITKNSISSDEENQLEELLKEYK